MTSAYFGKFFDSMEELLKEINSLELGNIDNILSDSNEDKTNIILNYYKNINNIGDDLCNKNAIIFSEGSTIIDGVNFFHLWNNELGEETRDNIWKFLFTMYIYAYLDIEKTDMGVILKKFKNLNEDEINKLEGSNKIIFSILDILNSEKKIKKLSKLEKSKPSKESGNLLEGFNFGEGIMNGEIGKLAKEIAAEINPEEFQSDLENEDPQNLLNNLFAGNLDKDSPILNLVQKISGKIHDKINGGNINEEALFSEAKNVLGKTNLFNDKKTHPNISKKSLKKKKKILKKKLQDKKKSIETN